MAIYDAFYYDRIVVGIDNEGAVSVIEDETNSLIGIPYTKLNMVVIACFITNKSITDDMRN